MHGRQSAANGRRRPLSLGWASPQVDAARMALRAWMLALLVGCDASGAAARARVSGARASIGECHETQAATNVEDAILKDLGTEHY